MQMENRINQELSARYRSSVITSSNAVGGLRTNDNLDDTPSAFTQPYRQCTVDDLNEISRTTLVLMVFFIIKYLLMFILMHKYVMQKDVKIVGKKENFLILEKSFKL